MDNKTPQQRSKNMAAVRAQNTKPEMILRKQLFGNGFRYRLNVKDLPGKPDIVTPKYKTAIFVNGCFWHGHDGCKKAALPETNTDFWREKIENTKKRDLMAVKELENLGWHVIICWECQILAKQPMVYIKDDYLFVDYE